MQYNVCTLFDSNYLIKGLALIQSVINHASQNIKWHVLALDGITSEYLRSNFPDIDVLDFGPEFDQELYERSFNRPWRETCWSAAACLLNNLTHKLENSEYLVYLDADCYFYNDITKMLTCLESFNIAIHEHNFSEDRKEWLNKSGRFNVGAVAGVVGQEFITCTTRWREQVLESCESIPSLGKCGDQTYLNEWPELYPNLYIWESPGVGLAPWNLNNFPPLEMGSSLSVAKSDLFFFHFHGLEIKFLTSFLALYVPAAGYNLRNKPIKYIFEPYIRNLMLLRNNLHTNTYFISDSIRLRWLVSNILKRNLYLVHAQLKLIKGVTN